LSDFGDAIPDIDEVRARLNIETVKAKIAEYKGKVNVILLIIMQTRV